jgi:hypothetical protein
MRDKYEEIKQRRITTPRGGRDRMVVSWIYNYVCNQSYHH